MATIRKRGHRYQVQVRRQGQAVSKTFLQLKGANEWDPGKPWQNGAAESFNGKFRDECLSLEWFRSRAEARVVIESWRRHYNEVRPHSSLGYLTPAAFAAKIREQDAAPGQATGRTAAVYGASALHPVAQPPRQGQSKAATGVVVSS
jgi:hypothetical protein